MKIIKKMGDIRLVEKMSKTQLQDYWLELKEARFDSFYYRELFERIKKMNPNLVFPSTEDMKRIEEEALRIAMWEENWESMNLERVRRGGVNYNLFRDEPMWVENHGNTPEQSLRHAGSRS